MDDPEHGTAEHRKIIEKWVDHLKTLPEVLLVLLEGSMVYGPSGPGSDIDLHLILEDDSFEELWRRERSRLLEGFGDHLVLAANRFARLLTPQGIIVEINAHKRSELDTIRSYGYQVLLSRLPDGDPEIPVEMVPLHLDHPPRRPLTPEIVVEYFHVALHMLAQLPGPFYNDEIESARFMLDGMRYQLIRLMYRRRNIRFAKRFKHLAQVLPETWRRELHDTYLPTSADPADPGPLAEAVLRGYQIFGHHLEALAEQAGGGFDAVWYNRVFEKTSKLLQPFILTQPRGPVPRMAQPDSIRLTEGTDDPEIDRILIGIIGILESRFPGRRRAYYLYGSYAFGTVTATSDLDLFVVFKDRIEPGLRAAFQETRHYCTRICNRNLDMKACDEYGLSRYGLPVLVRNTRFLYGKDIRMTLPENPVGFKEWAMHLPYGPNGVLAFLRRKDRFFRYPLGPPEPEEPFLGYDKRRIRNEDGTFENSVKMLASAVMQLGMGLIGVKTGFCPNNKAAFTREYREYVGDEWSDFVDKIHARCVHRWQGRIPKDEKELVNLLELCTKTLDFENHYLRRYREFLLAEICQPRKINQTFTVEELSGILLLPAEHILDAAPVVADDDTGEPMLEIANIGQLRATAMLGRVIYDDPEITAALKSRDADGDPLLKILVEQTLHRMDEAL